MMFWCGKPAYPPGWTTSMKTSTLDTPLPSHTLCIHFPGEICFKDLTAFMCSRNVSVEVLPNFCPSPHPQIIFPRCGRGEGWKLVESTYPAALHPSDPWRTTGSCWTLQGEKGNKMRKAAALVRPYIPLWSAEASDADPWPADWFIKHLLKTLPFLLAYKWPFKKKSWIVFGLWTFRPKILAEVCMLNDLQPVICVSGVMWREVEHPESSLNLLKAAVDQHLFKIIITRIWFLDVQIQNQTPHLGYPSLSFQPNTDFIFK